VANPFTHFSKRSRASRANERGRELDRQGRTADALAEYEHACRLDPQWSVPFYNIGLIHKYAGRWELSLQQNQYAIERNPSDTDACWNLGIAATALKRWDVARRAWRGAGINIPDGTGPIDFPCGRTPVRLNPATDGEVVWCDRLDPVRALIRNIPLPESGFRFHDVVLHDGAANGYRKLGDRECPVFDCLLLLEPSAFTTYVALIQPGDQHNWDAAMTRLSDHALDRKMTAEDWTSSVAFICQACSTGRPHEQHEHVPAANEGPHRVAIAAPDEHHARTLIAEWLPHSTGAGLLEFDAFPR
jgi:tetratricopeptide (TPR) repeat protein